MSNATHVLVPLSALPVLEQHAPILGDFYLAGEVSCALGYSFNWAGHDILCDEEVPVWGVLRVETEDFYQPGWGWAFSTFPCYTPSQEWLDSRS